MEPTMEAKGKAHLAYTNNPYQATQDALWVS